MLFLMSLMLIFTFFSVLLYQDIKPFSFNPDADAEDLIKNPQYTPVLSQYLLRFVQVLFLETPL